MQTSDVVATALTEMVEILGSSASVEDLEQAYLGEVRRFIDCPAVGFYVLDPLRQEAKHFEASGVSDYFLSRYEKVGRDCDPVLQRVLEDQTAVHSGALMSVDQWRSLEVYQEVFRIHRMVHLLEAPVVYDGQVIGTLNFGGDEDSEPFTSEHTLLAMALGRLVGTVLGSLRQKEDLQKERESLISALELCDEAVILTDSSSGHRRMNAAARRILQMLSGSPVDSFVDEHIVAKTPGECARNIEQTTATLPGDREAILRLHSTRLPENPDIVISFLTLRGFEKQMPPIIECTLTSRERDVASLAAQGLQDGEIAKRLYLSPFTVKQYLKNTYRKLEIRSRVDLALLLSESRGQPV